MMAVVEQMVGCAAARTAAQLQQRCWAAHGSGARRMEV